MLGQPTCHLDLGCGAVPRNPYHCDEVYGVDLVPPAGADPARFRAANLSLQPIPFEDSTFDSVPAFDFLEHVPRILSTAAGQATRFPFIELMDDIHRVLKPGGRLYALTPAFPSPAAFQDPTHVNIITTKTGAYFCGESPLARMYGFTGNFVMLRDEWALLPEAMEPTRPVGFWRRLGLARRIKARRTTHLVWEFACAKPPIDCSMTV